MPTDLMVEPSIYKSVKKLLQIPEGYDAYDMDVLIHLNTALGDITDIGIGPVGGFTVTSDNDQWTIFTEDDPEYEGIKTVVFLKMKLVFDPPQSGAAVSAMNAQIDQTMWRLSVRRENKAIEAAAEVPEEPMVVVDLTPTAGESLGSTVFVDVTDDSGPNGGLLP